MPATPCGSTTPGGRARRQRWSRRRAGRRGRGQQVGPVHRATRRGRARRSAEAGMKLGPWAGQGAMAPVPACYARMARTRAGGRSPRGAAKLGCYCWPAVRVPALPGHALAQHALTRAALQAGERAADVFMGVDCFGRGTYGGGGFNCGAALRASLEQGLSGGPWQQAPVQRRAPCHASPPYPALQPHCLPCACMLHQRLLA